MPAAAHYDGSSWETEVFDHSPTLDGMWGGSSDNVYASARNGKMLHYDGSTWTTTDTGFGGPTYYFPGLWGTGSGDVFAVGNHGIILHLGPSNQPPVAVCQDVVVAAGLDCTADASVDNGSYDPDGDPITLVQEPAGPYPLGDTLVTLTVTDDKGASDQCTATVTVVDADPPTIVLSEPYPYVLWPANHKFVDVMIMGIAGDNCDTDLAIDVSVEVLDVEGGDGGAKHDPDFEVVGAAIDDDGIVEILVSLRAERSGKGDGRIYEITVEVTDDSGNTGADTVYVLVPHDQGKGKKK